MMEEITQEGMKDDLIRMLKEALAESERPSPDNDLILDRLHRAKSRLGSLDMTDAQKGESLRLDMAIRETARRNYVGAQSAIRGTINAFGGNTSTEEAET